MIGSQLWYCQFTKGKVTQWSVDPKEELTFKHKKIFIFDMAIVSIATHDRDHADKVLED